MIIQSDHKSYFKNFFLFIIILYEDEHGYFELDKFDAWYKYYPAELYEIAILRCQTEGAVLWIPKSQEEITAVLALKKNITKIIIGLHDLFKRGAIGTVDGNIDYF